MLGILAALAFAARVVFLRGIRRPPVRRHSMPSHKISDRLGGSTPLGEAIRVRWLVALGLADATILLMGFLSRSLRQAPQIGK